MGSEIIVVGKAALDRLPEVKLVLDNLCEIVVAEEGEYLYLPFEDYQGIFTALLQVYHIQYDSPLSSYW